MSGSRGSLESSSHALQSRSAAPTRPVRIMCNAPAPDQWTLVGEMNMEKREPCEVWRSGAHHLLFKMKDELNKCSKVLEDLEQDLSKGGRTDLKSSTTAE